MLGLRPRRHVLAEGIGGGARGRVHHSVFAVGQVPRGGRVVINAIFFGVAARSRGAVVLILSARAAYLLPATAAAARRRSRDVDLR